MKSKKSIIHILISIICILIVTLFSFIYIGSNMNVDEIDITEYTIMNGKIPSEFDDFKIIQLSDFHSSGYKNTTELIISKVKEINPDIIVMTGDMINSDVENIEELENLINELVEIYSIYYINGNHEELAEILSAKKYMSFIKKIKSLGIIVLKNEHIEISKNRESINLYEIDIPLDGPTGLYVTEEQLDDNYVNDTLSEVDSDKFNILLAHNPLFIEQYSDWDVDLVLSGHMHGGIIRIPFIDIGIMSPEKKLFPNYDAGKFVVGDTTMIINRGIGASSFKLRVFNKPEISVITLNSK